MDTVGIDHFDIDGRSLSGCGRYWEQVSIGFIGDVGDLDDGEVRLRYSCGANVGAATVEMA